MVFGEDLCFEIRNDRLGNNKVEDEEKISYYILYEIVCLHLTNRERYTERHYGKEVRRQEDGGKQETK